MKITISHTPTRIILSTSPWIDGPPGMRVIVCDQWAARTLLSKYCSDPFTLTQLRRAFEGDHFIRRLLDFDIVTEAAARLANGNWRVYAEEIAAGPKVLAPSSTAPSSRKISQTGAVSGGQSVAVQRPNPRIATNPPLPPGPASQQQGGAHVTSYNSSSATPSAGAGVPALPTTLVGSQTDPRAGPNRSGTRHTSGPLTTDRGGTGNYEADLELLTGGTRPWQPGDKAPPGSRVGKNGIFGRSPNSSGGKSIDIPPNGNKPHETLHY